MMPPQRGVPVRTNPYLEDYSLDDDDDIESDIAGVYYPVEPLLKSPGPELAEKTKISGTVDPGSSIPKNPPADPSASKLHGPSLEEVKPQDGRNESSHKLGKDLRRPSFMEYQIPNMEKKGKRSRTAHSRPRYPASAETDYPPPRARASNGLNGRANLVHYNGKNDKSYGQNYVSQGLTPNTPYGGPSNRMYPSSSAQQFPPGPLPRHPPSPPGISATWPYPQYNQNVHYSNIGTSDFAHTRRPHFYSAPTPPPTFSWVPTPPREESRHSPTPDPVKIKLEAELAALREAEAKAKAREEKAQEESLIRKEVEETIIRHEEDRRRATEEAHKEIERVREEVMRTTRETVEAEFKQEQERKRQVEMETALIEKNVRAKLEAEAAAQQEVREAEIRRERELMKRARIQLKYETELSQRQEEEDNSARIALRNEIRVEVQAQVQAEAAETLRQAENDRRLAEEALEQIRHLTEAEDPWSGDATAGYSSRSRLRSRLRRHRQESNQFNPPPPVPTPPPATHPVNYSIYVDADYPRRAHTKSNFPLNTSQIDSEDSDWDYQQWNEGAHYRGKRSSGIEEPMHATWGVSEELHPLKVSQIRTSFPKADGQPLPHSRESNNVGHDPELPLLEEARDNSGIESFRSQEPFISKSQPPQTVGAIEAPPRWPQNERRSHLNALFSEQDNRSKGPKAVVRDVSFQLSKDKGKDADGSHQLAGGLPASTPNPPRHRRVSESLNPSRYSHLVTESKSSTKAKTLHQNGYPINSKGPDTESWEDLNSMSTLPPPLDIMTANLGKGGDSYHSDGNSVNVNGKLEGLHNGFTRHGGLQSTCKAPENESQGWVESEQRDLWNLDIETHPEAIQEPSSKDFCIVQ